MTTLYHGTTVRAAVSIMQQGFRPLRAGGRYSKAWYDGKPPHTTYASTSKVWASIFAARATKRAGGVGGGAIVEIRVPTRKVLADGGPFKYVRGVARQRIKSVSILRKSNLKRADWS